MYQDRRREAIKLRRAGWSYNVIVGRVNVSKSTLSLWLRDVPYSPNKTVRKRVNDGLLRSAMSRHAVRLQSLSKARLLARKDLQNVSQRDLMMLGLGLYIGEGTKRQETVHIMNSDPQVLKLALKWLKTCFKIPRKNLRVVLHLYPDNDEEESKKYWSKVTHIPLSQFEKCQIDRRKNKLASNRHHEFSLLINVVPAARHARWVISRANYR